MRETRILILTPLEQDTSLAADVLQGEGLSALPCRNMEDLCARVRRGAGTALLTEETLLGDEREDLCEVLRAQPTWSDFPLILLCRGGADSPPAHWALERLTNVLLLERPVRVATLVGALRNALRARDRQYQIRAHLRERERTAAELKRQAARLINSNAELERFAYVASHDLQEPLRTVLAYTQLLCLRYQGQMGEDADEFLSYIASGVDRMHRMIADLLAFSKVDAAPRTVRALDTEKLVQQVVRDLRAKLEEVGATVEVRSLPTLSGNETQLSQLFLNLIGNALKFRSDRKPVVEVSARKEGKAWVFSVADNGIGIEPAYHQRIFEVFRRLHGNDRYPGTGIGLAVCKRIVERYEGRIWVESQPGLGTVFHFRLPDPEIDEKAPPQRPPAARRDRVADLLPIPNTPARRGV